MRYTVLLVPGPSGYSASVPAMPGCSARGSDRREALTAVAGAMRHWLAVEGAHGLRPLTETRGLVLEAVSRALDDADEARPSGPPGGYQLELASVEASHPLLA